MYGTPARRGLSSKALTKRDQVADGRARPGRVGHPRAWACASAPGGRRSSAASTRDGPWWPLVVLQPIVDLLTGVRVGPRRSAVSRRSGQGARRVLREAHSVGLATSSSCGARRCRRAPRAGAGYIAMNISPATLPTPVPRSCSNGCLDGAAGALRARPGRRLRHLMAVLARCGTRPAPRDRRRRRRVLVLRHIVLTRPTSSSSTGA